VLTVTVSLAMVCAPDPVGVTFTFTVPLLLNRLMTALMFELIVVEVVAAAANTGEQSTAALSSAANPQSCVLLSCGICKEVLIVFMVTTLVMFMLT